MKTPYDPVVRIGRRETETLRLALRAEMERILALAEEAGALAERVRRECDRAAGDWAVSTYSWLQARRAEANLIARRKADAQAELGRLQSLARAAYGRMRAAERAADIFVERAKRETERKAQAEADDLANARRLLRQRQRDRAERQARDHDGPAA